MIILQIIIEFFIYAFAFFGIAIMGFFLMLYIIIEDLKWIISKRFL